VVFHLKSLKVCDFKECIVFNFICCYGHNTILGLLRLGAMMFTFWCHLMVYKQLYKEFATSLDLLHYHLPLWLGSLFKKGYLWDVLFHNFTKCFYSII
jgi:hypothetical protein